MASHYLLSWFALAAIAILNGIVRVSTYGKILPELLAHQLSTLTGILLTGAFAFYLFKRWPLTATGQAWSVGFLWLLATIVFEFGFGRYVAGHSWALLINDYNIIEGRVWSLFLLWMLIMPAVFHRLLRGAKVADRK